MKFIPATILSLMITGTQALASAGDASSEGMGLLSTFFIAFAVLVLLFQFLPGMALFMGMLKGIFSPEAKTGKESAGAGRSNL